MKNTNKNADIEENDPGISNRVMVIKEFDIYDTADLSEITDINDVNMPVDFDDLPLVEVLERAKRAVEDGKKKVQQFSKEAKYCTDNISKAIKKTDATTRKIYSSLE